MAATSARALLVQSIPVVAIQSFPTVRSGRQRSPSSPLVLKNVGQSPALINRVRVELRSLGSGGQILDSKDLGRELLNLGLGHEYALAPSDTLTIHLGARDHPAITETDPLHSACEVEYDDVLGNRFFAKHEPGRSFALAIKGSGGSWQPLEGFTLDPSTGRLVQPGQSL